ncbi:MAG: ABC transporter permease [Trueperaceae bacterium]|nr:ABC transporter permease [Trueperaceae bacterium]
MRYVKHLVFALVVFGAWEAGGRFGNPDVLPPFSAVVAAFVDILFGPLPAALFESLRLLVIGFSTALALGVFLGLVVGRYRWLDRTLSPYFSGLYALPTVALVPLVLIWFGFDLSGRVVVVFLASFFPILINVYQGARDTPPDLLEVARSFGVRHEWGLVRRVVIPAAVPFILAGVRLGIGRGVVGMAIAEVYLRLSGLGTLIATYGSSFQTAYLIAAILPLPFLGIVLTKLLALLERRFQVWST